MSDKEEASSIIEINFSPISDARLAEVADLLVEAGVQRAIIELFQEEFGRLPTRDELTDRINQYKEKGMNRI